MKFFGNTHNTNYLYADNQAGEHILNMNDHSRSTDIRHHEIKKTEGLELGAVDKLLVGIFVGHDEGGEDLPQLSSSTIVLFSLLSNNNNHDIIRPIESL